jgi:hypothetical protein
METGLSGVRRSLRGENKGSGQLEPGKALKSKEQEARISDLHRVRASRYRPATKKRIAVKGLKDDRTPLTRPNSSRNSLHYRAPQT